MFPSLTRFGYISATLLLLLVLAVMFFAPATATQFAVQIERLMAGIEEQHAEVDGFTIPYLEGGEGPTLLLLHGFTANKDNFSRIARHLTRDFRVFIPDLPGFGDASAPEDADYGIDAQVTRIADFMDAVGLEGAVHVGGNSMGGQLAAALALEHPERVASLWLLAPGGLQGEESSEFHHDYAETGRNALLVEDPADYDRVLETVFHEAPYLPWFVRDTLAKQAVERRAHYQRIFEQLVAGPGLDGRIGAIDAPTLLVWGEEDRILHPSGADVWMSEHGNTRLQMMPGVGHLPMMEAPKPVAEALLRFHTRRSAGD